MNGEFIFQSSSLETLVIAQGCQKSPDAPFTAVWGQTHLSPLTWALNPVNPTAGVNVVPWCYSHLTELTRRHALAPDSSCYRYPPASARLVVTTLRPPLVVPPPPCQGNSSVLLLAWGSQESLFLPWRGWNENGRRQMGGDWCFILTIC